MNQAVVTVELRLRATFSRMSDILFRSVPAGHFITTFYGIVDVDARRMVRERRPSAPAARPPGLLDEICMRANSVVSDATVVG